MNSWNAVKLNGQWYLCDPTWASGTPTGPNQEFVFTYNDGFFLADPQLFAVNHYPLEPEWSLLGEAAPSYDSFLKAPVLYGKAYTHLAKHDGPEAMHHDIKRGDTVQFGYTTQQAFNADDFSLKLDNGRTMMDRRPEFTTQDDRSLAFIYAFNSTGFYDVHVYYKTDLLATYTVKVRK